MGKIKSIVINIVRLIKQHQVVAVRVEIIQFPPSPHVAPEDLCVPKLPSSPLSTPAFPSWSIRIRGARLVVRTLTRSLFSGVLSGALALKILPNTACCLRRGCSTSAVGRVEDVFEDIRQSNNALEPVVVIDYDKSVNPTLPNSVKHSAKSIVLRTRVNPWAVVGPLA